MRRRLRRYRETTRAGHVVVARASEDSTMYTKGRKQARSRLGGDEKNVNVRDGVEAALKPLAQISDLMNGDDAACALGPIHLLRVRVLDAMQRAAVTAGDFESARDAARAVLPAYRLAYPPCHPPLGLHLALIAKIEAHLVDLNAAVQFAREAISCLNVSHGRNSDVVRMMETLLGESEAELRYNEYNRSGGNEDAETGEGYLEAYE